MLDDRPRRSARRLLLLAPLVLACGCASTDDGSDRAGLTEDQLAAYRVEVGDLETRPVALIDEREPGEVLTDLDVQLQRWNELLLSSDDADQRARRSMEEHLRLRARNHFELLSDRLVDGIVRHRTIAAAAIGFSADDAATPLLVAALDDESVDVVDAALLGIGMLADPATPMGPLARKLEQGVDGWTRSNAAFAIKKLLEAGAPKNQVHTSLRLALLDSWDSVRAQAAAALMIVGERKDIVSLEDALYDPATMVVLAAAKGVRRIGEEDDSARGEAARALFDAWQERDGRSVRAILRDQMAQLAQRNFGDEADQWREWAYGLP